MNMKTCKSGKSAYFRQVFVFNFLCIYTTFFNGLELKIPEAFFWILTSRTTEAVFLNFLNFYGAQELIARNRFRQRAGTSTLGS